MTSRLRHWLNRRLRAGRSVPHVRFDVWTANQPAPTQQPDNLFSFLTRLIRAVVSSVVFGFVLVMLLAVLLVVIAELRH